MSKDSKISWTHHTFNPWWGCTKVSSGCANCYAETFAHRCGYDVWGEYAPRRFFDEKHWREPIKWNKAAQQQGIRQRVFCGSMCDIFEENAPREEVSKLWDLINSTLHLDWLLLTKRPERIKLFLPRAWGSGWPNVWLMATVENQKSTDRIIDLLRVPAVIHGLSIEPMLESVVLQGQVAQYDFVYYLDNTVAKIDWVIVGGESGSKARPMHPDWVRSIRDQCIAANVPFFFKQWGEWLPNAQEYGCYQPDADYNKRHIMLDNVAMCRVGTRASGHKIDGREWQEYPS